MLLFLLLTAAAYFYFNWTYFALVEALEQDLHRRLLLVVVSFVINYMFFYLCSVLELPLVVNWLLFAFILFIETLVYNGRNKRSAFFTTLMGIIYGLAANIFCRSVVAIIMNLPLQRFDNHITSIDNLKGIPIFFGFILTGLILQVMRQDVMLKQIRLILRHFGQQIFLLEMMAGLFFYLFLNLLLYSTPLNDPLLKVWSIKSCLFCVIGFYIAARYTWRVCELMEYREQNRQIEQELQERQRLEEELRQQANIDLLTGLYNRHYAEETLTLMVKQKAVFSLCFLDLDGLKGVNDQYGHTEGNRYLLAVTQQIRRACLEGDVAFRYGGDEFLILFSEATAESAEKRVKAINDSLYDAAESHAVSYAQSISYGVVESTMYSDWKALIDEADRKMYLQKRRKKMARD